MQEVTQSYMSSIIYNQKDISLGAFKERLPLLATKKELNQYKQTIDTSVAASQEEEGTMCVPFHLVQDSRWRY